LGGDFVSGHQDDAGIIELEDDLEALVHSSVLGLQHSMKLVKDRKEGCHVSKYAIEVGLQRTESLANGSKNMSSEGMSRKAVHHASLLGLQWGVNLERKSVVSEELVEDFVSPVTNVPDSSKVFLLMRALAISAVCHSVAVGLMRSLSGVVGAKLTRTWLLGSFSS